MRPPLKVIARPPWMMDHDSKGVDRAVSAVVKRFPKCRTLNSLRRGVNGADVGVPRRLWLRAGSAGVRWDPGRHHREEISARGSDQNAPARERSGLATHAHCTIGDEFHGRLVMTRADRLTKLFVVFKGKGAELVAFSFYFTFTHPRLTVTVTPGWCGCLPL